jgi:hypothetical protein
VSEELQELIDSNPEWYKDLLLPDVKEFIRSNINSASRSFVAIGYYLKYIRDNQLFTEDGYQSIWEFAQSEFGISKSSSSRFMAINDRFSKDGNSPILLDQFKDFSSSKLSEMLTMTDEQLDRVTITTTVAEIREIKNPEKAVATSQQEAAYPKVCKYDGKSNCVAVCDTGAVCCAECPEHGNCNGECGWQEERMPKLSGKCIHRPEFPCTLPEASKLAIGNGEECNAKCCWNCPKREGCGYQCNSSAHRSVVNDIPETANDQPENVDNEPEIVNDVDESVTEISETVIDGSETEERIRFDFWKHKPVVMKCSNCNYNTMNPDKFREEHPDTKEFPCNNCDDKLNHWEPKIEKPEVDPDPVETIEADIIQTVSEDDQEDESNDPEFYTVFDIDSEMTSLMKWLEEFRKDNSNVPARRKSKMRWDAICLLDKQVREANIPKDPEPEPQKQPELPILKNNDQRKEFIEAFETWPIWIDQKKTGERYYRYNLTEKVAMVVKVSLRHIRGWGIQETEEVSYGAEQYYLLGIKSEWNQTCVAYTEEESRTFCECSSNKSALVDYLKVFQKK